MAGNEEGLAERAEWTAQQMHRRCGA
eukprot:COSAG06_NODE_31371_length_522_cov_5.167849_1_plen_25_part_01